jgi:8-oxo-dGTP pyrophosphatase MutT (NUDIX family)
MPQMYCKVFINKASLVFSGQRENECELAPNFDSNEDFTQWVETLYTLDAKYCFQIQDNCETWFQAFLSHHTLIEAAGGLVIDPDGRLLVIKRLGMWDLPKGKIEKGEKIEEAAMREVEEECGISRLTLKEPLPDTYHCYKLDAKYILKRTYWFEMQYSGSELPKPQTEEHITEVKFMEADKVERAKHNTYPSLLPIFNAYSRRYK